MVTRSLSPTFIAMIIFTVVFAVRVLVYYTSYGTVFDMINSVVGKPIMYFGSSSWAYVGAVINIGGAGNTIGLAINMLLFSKSACYKALGKLAFMAFLAVCCAIIAFKREVPLINVWGINMKLIINACLNEKVKKYIASYNIDLISYSDL